jgi:predicted secreted protein
MIFVAVACGSSKKSISNDATNATVQRKSIIQLKINEEKTIQLPSLSSDGPAAGFTLSDTSIAKVSRKETISTYDSTDLRTGDPVLANWVIKGLKSGTTRVKFAGRRPEKNNGANLRLKNFKIVVTE